MIDLVYILGKGSMWDDNELRYSLRSAEENFEFDRVFIIGDLPEWIKNVIHIPAEDTHTNKLLNARDKYREAIYNRDISEDFILMNDDFFFLWPVEKIKYYSRGNLKEVIENHKTKSGYYYSALIDTLKRLNEMGIENPKDFEIHAPIIFNKNELGLAIETIGEKKPYLIRTIYGNFLEVESIKTQDFKVENTRELEEKLTEDTEFLSITNGLVCNIKFRDWLKNKFPNVSKYENDQGEGAKANPGQSMSVRTYFATKDFEFEGKKFEKGRMIDMRTMKKIKQNPDLRRLWVFK